MTHRAVGFGRGFPRAWLLPILALVVVLGIAASGRLSRAIVADLIAWWPVWVGLGLGAFLLRDRRIGQVRAAGVVPLVALAFVLLFIWGHLAGWAIMPSASQRLVGPETAGFTSAELSADIDGRLEVNGGSEFLYQVEALRQGGRIGIPDATERIVDDSVMVDLVEPTDPGLYGYAGWSISLSPDPMWTLDLDGAVNADLTGIHISSLEVSGAGTVWLGATSSETQVTLGGSFDVVIPEGSAARVVGSASVPASWTLTEDGATSAQGAVGWVLTVIGDATLTVREAVVMPQ